jgi:methyl-branched lipid omega-hydroxylase
MPARAAATRRSRCIARWAAMVMYFRRNVTSDIEVNEHRFKEGDKVSIWYVSGDRDESVFPDPASQIHK